MRAAIAARIVAPRRYMPLVGLLAAQHVLDQGAQNLSRTVPSGLRLVVGSAIAWLLWRSAMGTTVWPAAGWRSLLAVLTVAAEVELGGLRDALGLSDPALGKYLRALGRTAASSSRSPSAADGGGRGPPSPRQVETPPPAISRS